MNLKSRASNQSGSISLLGTILISSLLGLTVLISLVARNRLFEIKSNKQLSLCFENILSQLKIEMKFMGKMNHSIKLAFIASQSPIPQVKAAAVTAHKVLMTTQTLRAASFPLKISNISECSKDISLKMSAKSPYGLILKRDPMGVAQLQVKQWNISTRTLWNTQLPNLKAELSLLDPFDTELKIKSSTSAGKHFWKLPFSYPSFSLQESF